MTDYENELNESQLRAVTYCDGPSLVIAGAGSGKTRVLTYKIAYLLEHGYQPWNILALTFTNKAAREMQERITRQVGPEHAAGLWMGTFHSIFARILRIEASVLGFTNNYTIYDAADQKSLIKSIVKEMGLDDKQYKASTVAAHISNAKNRLILPDAYAVNPTLQENDAAAKMPKTAEIYRLYWQRCRQADAMDFDDLLVYTAMLFHYHPEVLQKYAERFRYVLVDEYQDTNFAQHTIVYQLTKEHQHLCVVGDDAQSIYSFRGARIDNILQFSQQYKDVKTFKLEQNYRSTQMIVNAANSLIDKNQRQIHKEVFSEQDKGERIPVIEAASDFEEAIIVASRIRTLHHRDHIPYNDIAILYRTNAQSRSFEDNFRKEGLPYRIYGGLSFYQRKEVKDVIAYFRLVLNPNDEEAFKRIVNYPARGIGDTTVGKITSCATQQQVSLYKVVEDPATYGLQVNRGTQAKLQAFLDKIKGWREQLDSADAQQLGALIIKESGIWADLHSDNSVESISRQENIDELVNTLHDFVESRREEGETDLGLREYLAEVSLLTDQDSDEGDDDKITLMTVHAAKGLEFNTIFVVGMERDLFPSLMSSNSITELEEERRLFYVAITRAKQHCILTHAKNRYRYGKSEMCTPSPFLRDIDPRYLDIQDQDDRPTSTLQNFHRPDRFGYGDTPWGQSSTPQFIRRTVQPEERPRITPKVQPPSGLKKVNIQETTSKTSIQTAQGQLQAGNVIEHDRFGIGDVIEVSGQGDNAKAKVKFRNAGEKQLLLKFAKFKIIK